MRTVRFGLLTALCLLVLACSHTVTVKHEVEPIFITVQVNIQVQEQLNDFFDFEETMAEDDSEGGTQ